jgi:hypothetical protein
MAWTKEAWDASARVRHLKAAVEMARRKPAARVVSKRFKKPLNPSEVVGELVKIGVDKHWGERLQDMIDNAHTVTGRQGGDRTVSKIVHVQATHPKSWPLPGSHIRVTREDGQRFKLWMDAKKKFKITPLKAPAKRVAKKFQPPLYD